MSSRGRDNSAFSLQAESPYPTRWVVVRIIGSKRNFAFCLRSRNVLGLIKSQVSIQGNGPRAQSGHHFDSAVHELLGTEVVVLSPAIRIENTHEDTYQTSS